MVSDNLSQELKDQGVSIGSSINLFSDWTAQLGGPLLKDRLRFFTSWRDWRIHRDVVDFPESENTDMFSGLGNVTYQLNQRNRLTGLYTRQTYYKPNRNASALNPPRNDLDRRRCVHDLPGRVQLPDRQQCGVRCAGELLDHRVSVEPAAGRHRAERRGALDWREQRRGVAEFRPVAHTTGDRRRSVDLQTHRPGSITISRPATSTSGASPTPSRTSSRASICRFSKASHKLVIEYNSPVDEEEIFRGSVLHVQDNVGFGRCDAQPRPAVRALRRSAARTGCSGRSVLEPAVVPRRGRLFLEYARSADWSRLRSAPVPQGRGQSRVLTLLPRREHRLCLTSQPEQSRWDGIRRG